MPDSSPRKQRAETLRAFSSFLTPKPVFAYDADGKPQPEKHWLVDTDEGRGEYLRERFEDALIEAHSDGRAWRAIVAGHMGSGKSTELARLRGSEELQARYMIVFEDAERELPISGLKPQHVSVFCLRAILSESLKSDALRGALERDHIAKIEAATSWFDEYTINQMRNEFARGGLSEQTPLAFLRDLFLRYQRNFVSGEDLRPEVADRIERRLESLLDLFAELVEAAQAIAGRRFLLVIDGTDKIGSLEDGLKVFRDGRRLLQRTPCSVIYTVPIGIWFEGDEIKQDYDHSLLFPMIPVKSPPAAGSSVSEEERERKADLGVAALREIVLLRVDSGLLDDAALTAAIKMSGGVIRDLFRLLVDAAFEAKRLTRSRVEIADVKVAFGRLRDRHYRALLSPPESRATTAPTLTSESIDKALGRCADWPRRRVSLGPTERLLLQRLCLLEYNGDVWHDLHPAVADLLRIREAEEAARR